MKNSFNCFRLAGELVKAIQSQGRFADRKVNFTDIADDRLATEMVREMGHTRIRNTKEAS
jgi:hypothetical protein